MTLVVYRSDNYVVDTIVNFKGSDTISSVKATIEHQTGISARFQHLWVLVSWRAASGPVADCRSKKDPAISITVPHSPKWVLGISGGEEMQDAQRLGDYGLVEGGCVVNEVLFMANVHIRYRWPGVAGYRMRLKMHSDATVANLKQDIAHKLLEVDDKLARDLLCAHKQETSEHAIDFLVTQLIVSLSVGGQTCTRIDTLADCEELGKLKDPEGPYYCNL
jgi:hypothetical protein